MPSTPNLILQYFCLGLRLKLGLDASCVFPSILPVYDEGWQGDMQILVTPGDCQPDGGGKGNQDGGALIIRQKFDLTVFYRLNLDPHGRSDQILTENTTGLIDFFENIKAILLNTNLGGLSIERLQYEGESKTTWADPERGIVQRTITYSASYGKDILGLTLTDADLISQLPNQKS